MEKKRIIIVPQSTSAQLFEVPLEGSKVGLQSRLISEGLVSHRLKVLHEASEGAPVLRANMF